MATFHPSPELLLEYATGRQPETVAIVVATHLALCPSCRREVADYEAVGGRLLEASALALIDESTRTAVLRRLDTGGVEPVAPTRPGLDLVVPQPLRGYLGGGLDRVTWRRRGRALESFELPALSEGYRLRLLRISSGQAMPRHTHAGVELTLVLTGGFSDQAGHYLRGDVDVADETIDHQPIADRGEDCVCVAVNFGRVRLSGPIGRWINPLIRF